jgi:hypothetical protein
MTEWCVKGAGAGGRLQPPSRSRPCRGFGELLVGLLAEVASPRARKLGVERAEKPYRPRGR